MYLNIHWKDWCWSWNSNTWATLFENWLIRKDPDVGKDWRQEEKGMTEDEMVGWHHWLDGHEFEQVLGVADGQGSLACCSPWGRKESGTNEWLNWTELEKGNSQNSETGTRSLTHYMHFEITSVQGELTWILQKGRFPSKYSLINIA